MRHSNKRTQCAMVLQLVAFIAPRLILVSNVVFSLQARVGRMGLGLHLVCCLSGVEWHRAG